MDQQSSKTIIDLSWCIGILVLIAIFLFSKDLSTVPDIKDIMSFALTFSSLLLAIIAIVQSTVASNSSSTALASLVSVSREVEQKTRDLSVLTDSMPKTFEQMQAAMSSISANTEELRLEMMRNQERADPTAANKKMRPNYTPGSALETIFLTNGQVLALYLCIRAFDTSRPLSPANVLQPALSGEYQIAVISTLKIFNLLDVEEIVNGFVVNGLGAIEPYRDYIISRAEDQRLQFFASVTPRIDSYFGPRTAT